MFLLLQHHVVLLNNDLLPLLVCLERWYEFSCIGVVFAGFSLLRLLLTRDKFRSVDIVF